MWRDKPQDEQLKAELQWYRGWANEIMEFFRDHRHQDVNDVYVDVTEIDACSKCGNTWEPYEDEGELLCANCGAVIRAKQAV